MSLSRLKKLTFVKVKKQKSMELILFIIIIIFLIVIKNSLDTKFEILEDTIKNLTKRVQTLQDRLLSKEVLENKVETLSEKEIVKPTIEESILIREKEFKPISEEPKVIVSEGVKEKLSVSSSDNTVKSVYPIEDELTKTPLKKTLKEHKVVISKKSWFEKFKEENPDLEEFIGENLINKIGILILVLGISFFVKYAIDKDWINEPARVGIGMLCGSLVMGIAHKLKKNYASFSSVLVAGAISIFYFTIYIAFHEYQLFSQTIAFVIMVIITAFSTLVSISYNRQELAVLSLIGGFGVPFMLSTGEGNYIVLFSYVTILNIGILAVSYFKKWKVATILSFVFTTILYSGWLTSKIDQPEFPHIGAIIFAAISYFIFSVTIVLNNLRNKGVFSVIEYSILIANTFFFFGVGMLILKDIDSDFTGLFTLLLSVYNLFYAIVLYKKFGLDKNAIYLLIGLALTFVTLTIPIQFDGNQITLFWAAEGVLLLWLSQKSKISYFKIGAIVVQLLAIISLLMDWSKYSNLEEYSIVFNPLFIAGLVVSISLFLSYRLLKKEKDIVSEVLVKNIRLYKVVVLIIAILVTYFVGVLEVSYQSYQYLSNSVSAYSLPVTYHFVFVAILLFLSLKFNKDIITKGILILSVLSIALYIVVLYGLPTKEIIENYASDINSNYAFYLHYITLGCIFYFGLKLFKNVNLLFNIEPKQNKWLTWVFVFAIVYVLSNEIMIHSLYFLDSVDLTVSGFNEGSYYQKISIIKGQINDSKAQIVKIGYPILWGVFSFIFLIIGVKKQLKNLRIIALSLLGITIIKLFTYDIKDVSETGKIIAFILLGVLILIISFVYQKIKKLVVDETKEKNIAENNIE